MNLIQIGDTIRMHYKTYADDGCMIETSEQREPLEFVVGSADVIAGINRAVIGMHEKESRRFAVSPEGAFGHREPDLQQLAPRLGLLEKCGVEDQLAVDLNGHTLDIWIRSVTEDEILLDANHPLAGESLIYEIEVIQVSRRASATGR